MTFDRIFVGRLRPEWKGRKCRITQTWRGRHAKHSVRIEFEDGGTAICPIRCTKRIAAVNATEEKT